jgi:hypothetical protein
MHLGGGGADRLTRLTRLIGLTLLPTLAAGSLTPRDALMRITAGDGCDRECAPMAHSSPCVQMQIHVGAWRAESGPKCAWGEQNPRFGLEMCRWEHIRAPSRAQLLPRVRPRHTLGPNARHPGPERAAPEACRFGPPGPAP